MRSAWNGGGNYRNSTRRGPAFRGPASRGPAFRGLVLGCCLLFTGSAPLLCQEPDTDQNTRLEVLADPSGFLFGEVETRSGTFRGLLRFGRSTDAFWSHLVKARREKQPYRKLLPLEARLSTEKLELFGRTLERRRLRHSRRNFSARFGDLKRIEVHSRRWSTMVLKDGTEIDVGGSADLGRQVMVTDAEGKTTKVDWMRILRIRLMPADADFPVRLRRMFGRVETASGSLEGFIQWDDQESIESDLIEGDGPSGAERALPMGEIAAIEKVDNAGSRFILTNGEEVVLTGSNDVDEDNRGIWVDSPQWGRISVDWRSFERLEWKPVTESGPGYAEFPMPEVLRGRVLSQAGDAFDGRLVYDADEAYSWELLEGSAEGWLYSIPFAKVRSVEPLGPDSSRVTLHDGSAVELQGSSDINKNNEGVMIFDAEGGLTYLPWAEVAKVEFQAPAEELTDVP